jgi:hypothetical protein
MNIKQLAKKNNDKKKIMTKRTVVTGILLKNIEKIWSIFLKNW